MKKTMLLILTLMFLTVSTVFAEWDTADKALFGTYVALEIVDGLQTHSILHDDDFYEINPLITDDTSMILCMAATTGLIWLLADRFPKCRKFLLSGAIIVKASMVSWNFSIGVRF